MSAWSGPYLLVAMATLWVTSLARLLHHFSLVVARTIPIELNDSERRVWSENLLDDAALAHHLFVYNVGEAQSDAAMLEEAIDAALDDYNVLYADFLRLLDAWLLTPAAGALEALEALARMAMPSATAAVTSIEGRVKRAAQQDDPESRRRRKRPRSENPAIVLANEILQLLHTVSTPIQEIILEGPAARFLNDALFALPADPRELAVVRAIDETQARLINNEFAALMKKCNDTIRQLIQRIDKDQRKIALSYHINGPLGDSVEPQKADSYLEGLRIVDQTLRAQELDKVRVAALPMPKEEEEEEAQVLGEIAWTEIRKQFATRAAHINDIERLRRAVPRDAIPEEVRPEGVTEETLFYDTLAQFIDMNEEHPLWYLNRYNRDPAPDAPIQLRIELRPDPDHPRDKSRMVMVVGNSAHYRAHDIEHAGAPRMGVYELQHLLYAITDYDNRTKQWIHPARSVSRMLFVWPATVTVNIKLRALHTMIGEFNDKYHQRRWTIVEPPAGDIEGMVEEWRQRLAALREPGETHEWYWRWSLQPAIDDAGRVAPDWFEPMVSRTFHDAAHLLRKTFPDLFYEHVVRLSKDRSGIPTENAERAIKDWWEARNRAVFLGWSHRHPVMFLRVPRDDGDADVVVFYAHTKQALLLQHLSIEKIVGRVTRRDTRPHVYVQNELQPTSGLTLARAMHLGTMALAGATRNELLGALANPTPPAFVAVGDMLLARVAFTFAERRRGGGGGGGKDAAPA